MKILSFSYCFPNEHSPNWGVFVYQRQAALAQLADLRVCSPSPWFPILKKAENQVQLQKWQGLDVYRPRFFYFPGILKSIDAKMYARGLLPWLKEISRKWQPDILDAHFIWPDGVAVALMARQLGIPYCITLRGKLYECLKVPEQIKQCEMALQSASAVISVSSRMAGEAAALGVAENRLHVITNGVNLDHFRPNDKLSCRQQLNLPKEGRLLVTVAHLGHRKGHHEMIKALAHLPQDVRLIIVGGAAQGGSEAVLRGVAEACGVTDRLILTGAQPYERIPLYLSAANASVLASYREGCPNAVLESLACGTPVIATDVGAVPDILPVPDAGRIVPARQVEPLSQAVADVLAQTWNPLDVVAKSGVRSWAQVAKEVKEVLEKY